MQSIQLYHKKMASASSTSRERNLARLRKNLNYVCQFISKAECVIDGAKTEASFQDQSQSNNKDLSDDKYLVVPNGIEVGIGSYVNWDGRIAYLQANIRRFLLINNSKSNMLIGPLSGLVDKKIRRFAMVAKAGDLRTKQTMYVGCSFSGDHCHWLMQGIIFIRTLWD